MTATVSAVRLAPNRATNAEARAIEATVLRLLAAHPSDASIGLIDAARACMPGAEEAWRALMPTVRAVAQRMADDGRLLLTRRAASRTEAAFSPIHLARGPRFHVA
jgi:hypothetical protein